MVIAGIAGIITSWNAFYIGGSRAIYALANAGMLPSVLPSCTRDYKTPTNGRFSLDGLSILSGTVIWSPALVWIVNAGGLGIVLAYLFVARVFHGAAGARAGLCRVRSRVSYGKLCGSLAIILSFRHDVSLSAGKPGGRWAWPKNGGGTSLPFWVLLGIGLYIHALRTYGRDYSDRHMKADPISRAPPHYLENS